MTERTTPESGSVACPFLAFEDDRDERTDHPDHRHRCYAEVRPAPRAIAHQEAYCLSSGFAACPTFQDWARRESAKTRRLAGGDLAGLARGSSRQPEMPEMPSVQRGGAGERGPSVDRDDTFVPGAMIPGGPGGAEPDDFDDTRSLDARLFAAGRGDRPGGRDHFDEEPGPGDGQDEFGVIEDLPQARKTPRDWAAPPPWVQPGPGSGVQGLGDRGHGIRDDLGDDDPRNPAGRSEPPPSEIAGLARSRWLQDGPAPRPDDDRPGAPGPAGRSVGRPGDGFDPEDDEDDLAGALPADGPVPPTRPQGLGGGLGGAIGRLPGRSSLPGREAQRPSVSASRRRQPIREATPAWERPLHREAFPTLKTRVGLPSMSRITLAAVALIVAAVVLFSLPFLLKLAGGGGATATPTPSPSPSVSLEPTATPIPTPVVYVVKSGDTLTKIAKKFGLTVEQILAANKQIKNANSIKIGDQLTIPGSVPTDVVNGASPSPSSSPSPGSS